ncbi:hypothetical protein [uncultured Algibacter sp.]|uniref:OB-fold protein n=1 Tax=uncultured Algibacter sp. TaxID=298659 RepID=UPI002614F8F9|nr:hypothetical protein [uncultured Algibacter sp.]
MRKWLILFFVVIIGIFVYQYVYQDHRNIKLEKAEYTLTATDISNAFLKNLSASEEKFLNNTVEIAGNITELSEGSLTIDDLVFCSFEGSLETKLRVNSEITIKGRVIGFDDLLEQVKLDQCIILNN